MNLKEIIDRNIAGDARVYNKMMEIRRTDQSFMGKPLNIFRKRYSQDEAREIWFNGIELGLKEGLNMGSLEGQKIDLYSSNLNKKQREYIDKIFKLSEEYNCAIQYNPLDGMCIVDKNP